MPGGPVADSPSDHVDISGPGLGNGRYAGYGGHQGVRRPRRGLDLRGHLARPGRSIGDSVIVRVRSAVPLKSRTGLCLLDRRWRRSRPGLLRRLPSQHGLRRGATTRAFLRGSSVSVRSVPGTAASRRYPCRQAGVDPNPATLLEEPRERPGRRAVQGREHEHRGLGCGSPNLRALGQAVARTAGWGALDRIGELTVLLAARLNLTGRPARSCRCRPRTSPPAMPAPRGAKPPEDRPTGRFRSAAISSRALAAVCRTPAVLASRLRTISGIGVQPVRVSVKRDLIGRRDKAGRHGPFRTQCSA